MIWHEIKMGYNLGGLKNYFSCVNSKVLFKSDTNLSLFSITEVKEMKLSGILSIKRPHLHFLYRQVEQECTETIAVVDNILRKH
jgi:hypothetical protein